MAVQIAKALGAEVTGVCGLPATSSWSGHSGRTTSSTTPRRTSPRAGQRYDVVLDNVLNHPPKATARVLAPDGMLIPNSIGYTGGLLAGLPRMARAVLMGLGSHHREARIPCREPGEPDALLRLLEPGQVRVIIDKTYPLDQAANAVTQVLEHHAGGKIAITA